MMIALAIINIVAFMVVPSTQHIIEKARIRAQLNEISALVRYAKWYAINERITVTICPAHDYQNCQLDYNLPLIMFVDTNANLQRDLDEPLISASSTAPRNQVKGPNVFIRFYESGRNSSAASVVFCPKSLREEAFRALFISLQGRTRVSTDSDNDGVHEHANGQALSCAE